MTPENLTKLLSFANRWTEAIRLALADGNCCTNHLNTCLDIHHIDPYSNAYKDACKIFDISETTANAVADIVLNGVKPAENITTTGVEQNWLTRLYRTLWPDEPATHIIPKRLARLNNLLESMPNWHMYAATYSEFSGMATRKPRKNWPNDAQAMTEPSEYSHHELVEQGKAWLNNIAATDYVKNGNSDLESIGVYGDTMTMLNNAGIYLKANMISLTGADIVKIATDENGQVSLPTIDKLYSLQQIIQSETENMS